VNTVLFDFGAVLIDWNPRYLYRPLFGNDEAAMERFLGQIVAPEWNHEIDLGKPFAQAVAERILLYPQHAELIALWERGWPEMLRGPIAGTVEILAQLRERGHRLYALSNWSAETFPLARRRFEFLGWFEDIVVSGEVKLAKPDPRIFSYTIGRCRLTPAETVFIDDNPQNVAAGRQAGLHALAYTGASRLRVDLGLLGLL
jgi:2-haloacid dehalogenase